MKKAFEYSKMCNADVCVGIRMRETGQVHILSADATGFWAFLTTELVGDIETVSGRRQASTNRIRVPIIRLHCW